MIKVQIKFFKQNLPRLKSLLAFEYGQEEWEDCWKKWGLYYRSEMKERFDIYSKGGGDWAPLKPSTIYRRRHGKGGRYKRGKKAYLKALATGGGQVSILRDTGTLFNALSPTLGKLGQRQDIYKNGVGVGFADVPHPRGGTATIAQIASYHQTGGKHLPKREILVEPNDTTKLQMVRYAEQTMQKLLKGMK
ncbi:MAG TPA: hypothetical protein PLP49_10895 [Anaerohalosphaeraceae bacterium]|nr:hypothetical protein [Anaerohalosphaeraceae bacterium]